MFLLINVPFERCHRVRTRRKSLTSVSLVSIGISFEGRSIHDSLVVHQLVPFVIGQGIDLVVFWVSDDLMGSCEGISQITIWVGLECAWIHDSLIVHELVKLGLVMGEEFIGFRVSDNLVSFVDLGLSGFLDWLLDFVQDVLSHDVIV